MTAPTVRDIIKRASRLHGAIATGDDPTSDEMNDAMLALNTMKRALFGTVIGVRVSPQDATGSAKQAENGGEYQIPAAVFSLTAPLNPRSGARFGVVDANLNFATQNCTIIRNARLLEGAAANIVLSTTADNRRWWFRGDTGNWVREADYLTPELYDHSVASGFGTKGHDFGDGRERQRFDRNCRRSILKRQSIGRSRNANRTIIEERYRSIRRGRAYRKAVRDPQSQIANHGRSPVYTCSCDIGVGDDIPDASFIDLRKRHALEIPSRRNHRSREAHNLATCIG